MKYVVKSATVESELDVRLLKLNKEIQKHRSNLDKIKSEFNLFLSIIVSEKRFELFCQGSDKKHHDLVTPFIAYEMHNKFGLESDSVYIYVHNERDFGYREHKCEHQFTLYELKHDVELTLSSNVNTIVSLHEKLQKIHDKCVKVEEFIFDEKEYHFIFGE